MEVQQFAVIHLVNMIPAKDQYILRILPFDCVDVLINGIGRSLIPLLRRTKLRRNREDEFTTVIREDIPAQTDVAIERIGFVLGEDTDSLQLGIDTVR